ncbi:histidinol-phosphatase HisJ family protein [Salipaludibacillus daqingensis]|uniref:histidinol-phosphatase HisJ family protein n=1 Tax=Salipaludibacillus daqingensis TaxID=3041001 RepID=UPI002475A5F8|nr:histidinol-phosphatase HisJ family protein [Salipaludibacillus daqingensis]
MIIDYHTHHERCGHATGSIRDMIEKAIQQGISHIGISDHSPLYIYEEDHFNPGMTMAKSEFPNYYKEIFELKEEYKGMIDVRLGVESDYFEGWETFYKELYSQYSFDFIIGSVHYFGGYHVFNPERWKGTNVDRDEIYKEYFSLVRKAANSGMFDILGHIDAVKGLGYQPVSSMQKEMEETANVIAKSNMAVELNTSGIRKCGEIFPSTNFLSLLHDRGVPFTFGSDAHSPEELSHGWKEALAELKQLGVTELATFENRERKMMPLNELLVEHKR